MRKSGHIGERAGKIVKMEYARHIEEVRERWDENAGKIIEITMNIKEMKTNPIHFLPVCKHTVVGLLIVIALAACTMSPPKYPHSINMHFDTITDQRLALNYYAEKTKSSKNDVEKAKYLRLFFEAFPKDFETFFQITYEESRGDIFYTVGTQSYVFSNNPWGPFYPIEVVVKTDREIPKEEEASGKFPKLSIRYYNYYDTLKENGILKELASVIPQEVLYKKLLAIGIGGFWDADDVGFFQLHLHGLVYRNKPLAVEVLSHKKDREIASFFYFLYDGPHPDHPHTKESYKALYESLSKLDPRIAFLLKVAYEKLLSEKHCPGH